MPTVQFGRTRSVRPLAPVLRARTGKARRCIWSCAEESDHPRKFLPWNKADFVSDSSTVAVATPSDETGEDGEGRKPRRRLRVRQGTPNTQGSLAMVGDADHVAYMKRAFFDDEHLKPNFGGFGDGLQWYALRVASGREEGTASQLHAMLHQLQPLPQQPDGPVTQRSWFPMKRVKRWSEKAQRMLASKVKYCEGNCVFVHCAMDNRLHAIILDLPDVVDFRRTTAVKDAKGIKHSLPVPESLEQIQQARAWLKRNEDERAPEQPFYFLAPLYELVYIVWTANLASRQARRSPRMQSRGRPGRQRVQGGGEGGQRGTRGRSRERPPQRSGQRRDAEWNDSAAGLNGSWNGTDSRKKGRGRSDWSALPDVSDEDWVRGRERPGSGRERPGNGRERPGNGRRRGRDDSQVGWDYDWDMGALSEHGHKGPSGQRSQRARQQQEFQQGEGWEDSWYQDSWHDAGPETNRRSDAAPEQHRRPQRGARGRARGSNGEGWERVDSWSEEPYTGNGFEQEHHGQEAQSRAPGRSRSGQLSSKRDTVHNQGQADFSQDNWDYGGVDDREDGWLSTSWHGGKGD